MAGFQFAAWETETVVAIAEAGLGVRDNPQVGKFQFQFELQAVAPAALLCDG
jgi:hypothetical protein